MRPPPSYLSLSSLTPAQAGQLHALYQGEWWTAGRTLAEVHTMLQHSDFLFALAHPDSHELVAFARVLTDRVFKALILDVIVHPGHRSVGLGTVLLHQITAHPVLAAVRHLELYCLPERTAFYRHHGFISELGELQLMRRSLPQPSPPFDHALVNVPI